MKIANILHLVLAISTAFAQSNDDCSNAIQIASFPFSSSGDTSLASSDFTSTVCQVGSEDKGLWYSIIGDGRSMTVTVTDATADSQLALFSGSNCDQLFCLDHNTNTGYRSYGSSLTFLSEIGTVYRVHVSGRSGSTGTFTVDVVAHDHPFNDQCESATPVSAFPASLSGTTVGAYTDVDSTICEVDKDARGVWYLVVGDGEAKRVAVASTAEFDSRIAVFSGTCGQRLCIRSNSNTGYRSRDSVLTFLTEVGVNYLILITSSTADVTNVGSFTLSLQSFERPQNDSCDVATEVSTFPVTLSGTTIGAYADVDSTVCQVVPNARGVWYLIVGDGNAKQISVDGTAEFDSRLAVFSGRCGQLNCIASNTNDGYRSRDSQITILTTVGESYFVLVTSSSSGVTNVGSFTMNVQSFERPSNDSCEGAVGVATLPATFSGSTIGAYPDVETPVCDVNRKARGTWYGFVGNGNVVMITIESTSQFDSRLAVFIGSCDTLSCLQSNSNTGYRNFSSQLEIETVNGETYYVLVTSNSGDITSVGSYTLVFSGQGPLATFPVSDTLVAPTPTPRPSIRSNTLTPSAATLSPVAATNIETPQHFFPPYETNVPLQSPVSPPTLSPQANPTTMQEALFPPSEHPTRGSVSIPTNNLVKSPTLSPSKYEQNPLSTFPPSNTDLNDFKSTRGASAQDFLIIANVILSFLKSSISVFAYSWGNVVLALLEVVVTSITMALFVLNDFVKDDGTSQYGDNILIYLASFGIALIVEVVGVVTTCKALSVYKRLCQRDDLTKHGVSNATKLAQGIYVFYFVLLLISSGGIIPPIAMSKANWITDYFGPVDFAGKVEILVQWSVGLALVTQLIGGVYFLVVSEATILRAASGDIGWPLKLQALLGVAYSILAYTTLSMVSGQEAGGFCYLFLINIPQAIELAAEVGRHIALLGCLGLPANILQSQNFLEDLYFHIIEETDPQQAEELRAQLDEWRTNRMP